MDPRDLDISEVCKLGSHYATKAQQVIGECCKHFNIGE